MSTTVLEKDTTFTAADRCDRCGAAAQYRVILAAGELLFCGHHGRRHMDKLRQTALEVIENPNA